MKMVDAINSSAAGFGLTSSINSEVSQNRNNDDFERGSVNRRRGRDFDRIEISGDARVASNSSQSSERSNSSSRADFFSNFRNFSPQGLNRAADESNARVALEGRFGQARDRLVEIRERIIARFQDRFGGTPSVDDPTTNEPSGAETDLDDSQGVVDAPTENETPTDTFPGDPNSVDQPDTNEDPIPGDSNASDDTAPLGNTPENDTVPGLPNQGSDTTVEDAFPGDPDSNPQTTDTGIGTGSTNDGSSSDSSGIGLGGGSTTDVNTTTTNTGIGTGSSSSNDDSSAVTLPPADETSIGSSTPQPAPERTPVQIQQESPQTFVAPTSSLGTQNSSSSFIRIIDI